ncbi:MAG: hypothetical protein IK080_05570 [Clostridia bacterium]|nr:hypothetical protein [Clostridia bacterium]
MEIGSFLPLAFASGNEYYRGTAGVARLNTGRAAIWHAFRVTGCAALWLPYYQCDTVRAFLERKGCALRYYHINERFEPMDLQPAAEDAVLLVNYYGVMSARRMQSLAARYAHPIIDNCQAFFAEPFANALHVYSARKFVGVPDGAYVVGPGAEQFCAAYPQGYSSDTAGFLLERLEYGCEGKAYAARTVNEERIDSEDAMRMSVLTRTILDGTDYDGIRAKRRANFDFAARRFRGINRLDATAYYGADCVPMVYPLVVEDDSLLDRLLANKHFQGHWWSYLLDELPQESFEYYLSRYIIPVTIDQRYGETEIDFIRSLI